MTHNIHRPLFVYDENRAPIPKWIIDHPIVGAGRGGGPRRVSSKQLSRCEAFGWLITRREIEWCGTFQAPYLHLRLGRRIDTDPSRAWGWRPSFARDYVRELYAHGLLSHDLFTTLLTKLPAARGLKRADIPRRTRETVLAKTSGKCAYCGVRLTTDHGKPNSYHPDHVLPVACGGSDDVANLIPSCRSCNLKKRAKTALNFLGGEQS